MPPPKYAARIENLIDGQAIRVRCDRCLHQADVPVAVFKAKLSPNEFVTRLPRHLKCSRCGVRGVITAWISAAMGYEWEQITIG